MESVTNLFDLFKLVTVLEVIRLKKVFVGVPA